MSISFKFISRCQATASRAGIVGRRFVANGRTFQASKPLSSPATVHGPNSRRVAQVGLFGAALAAGQFWLGSASDFFDERFVTTKRPEDLADFYGTEDFMEVFCVLPFMVDFMMRGAHFDDDGTIHAFGLMGPGELEVSIAFDEEEADTTGDGVPDTLVWFNKKEHFRDAPPLLGGLALWEMTQNFGYHRYDDGTCVVYHQGEKFSGFFLVRLLFQLHAKYVIWATEKYVNNPAFGSEENEDELEEQRHNIPLHVFKAFLLGLQHDIEHKRDVPKPDSKEHQHMEVTLRKLKTIVGDLEGGNRGTLPTLRTLRSQKSRVAHVHLVIDDDDTKDTIRDAVRYVGVAGGSSDNVSRSMAQLVRRTTLDAARTRDD